MSVTSKTQVKYGKFCIGPMSQTPAVCQRGPVGLLWGSVVSNIDRVSAIVMGIFSKNIVIFFTNEDGDLKEDGGCPGCLIVDGQPIMINDDLRAPTALGIA
jgi:hypothetical protein